MLLELPVLAFTLTVLVLLEERTMQAVLPHALSLAQTGIGFAANLIWVTCIAPRCTKHADLTMLLASTGHTASKRVAASSSTWLLGSSRDAAPDGCRDGAADSKAAPAARFSVHAGNLGAIAQAPGDSGCADEC